MPTPDDANALDGRRILVVEDESIVAMEVGDALADLGCAVVGPVSRVAAALPLAVSASLDGAVLDVNLRGERIDAVADALAARGIPFVFLSGYGAEGVPARHRDRPVLDKPFDPFDLVAGLRACLRA